MSAREGEPEEGAQGGRLHGDVLGAVVSRISALDLLPASCVCKDWHAAVLASLCSSPRRPRPPCLILRLHGRRGASTYAFDPVSRTWLTVPLPPRCTLHGLDAPAISALASSHAGGARFYALSSSALSLAADPFGASWIHLEPPRYRRTDPVVVALVGHRIVAAGGTSELEDGEWNSVEAWDGLWWEPCEPMPDAFRWSPALSAATSERRLYVLEKQAPFAASWFDPEAKRWGPSRRLFIPDPAAGHAAIGFLKGRLVVAAAAAGLDGWPESVRLWAVDEGTLEVAEEVGRMPGEMVAGLVEEEQGEGGWGLQSLGFLSEGGFAYIYNPSYMREFFMCELEKDSGQCRWERAPPPPGLEERTMDRVVFGCGEVSVSDLNMPAAPAAD